MQRQVELTSIEIGSDHVVRFRLGLSALDDDGDPIGNPQIHRGAIAPGEDAAAILADVSAHIAERKWPPIPAADVARIGAIVAIEHTPDVIAAWRSTPIGE